MNDRYRLVLPRNLNGTGSSKAVVSIWPEHKRLQIVSGTIREFAVASTADVEGDILDSVLWTVSPSKVLLHLDSVIHTLHCKKCHWNRTGLNSNVCLHFYCHSLQQNSVCGIQNSEIESNEKYRAWENIFGVYSTFLIYLPDNFNHFIACSIFCIRNRSQQTFKIGFNAVELAFFISSVKLCISRNFLYSQATAQYEDDETARNLNLEHATRELRTAGSDDGRSHLASAVHFGLLHMKSPLTLMLP